MAGEHVGKELYLPLKLVTVWYILNVTAMKGTKHLLALKNNLLSMLTSRALVIHVDIPWCD